MKRAEEQKHHANKNDGVVSASPQKATRPKDDVASKIMQNYKQPLLRYPFLESPLERGLPEAWK